ncbi:MAG: hypothetical protein GEU95_24330 [Rhizobiales bacterium]|nr:hypothetical protein [Hyphomicrobiales bacterium]
MKERRTDDAAALLLGQRDVGLGECCRVDLTLHHQVEAIARAVGCAAHIDQLARYEAFQEVQREVMRAGIERHADRAAGKLLRGVDRRVGAHHDGGVGDDGAAADLAAADIGCTGAAVVAPFAGIVHVGFALFEQRAMAAEGIGGFDVFQRGVGGLDAGFITVCPLDLHAFLGEQAFVIGYELRQTLKWGGGFEDELLHWSCSVVCCGSIANESSKFGAVRHALRKTCAWIKTRDTSVVAPMRVTLFHNTTAGGGKFTKKELVTALRLGGLEPRYVSTKSRRFKKELAQAEGLVVVAGGDGTVTKVIAQMPDRRVPVAILPLGSANNIARSFGVAGAPYELAEMLHPLYWERLSVGVVRGPWGRRRFVEAVGLGPLARMMKKPSLDGTRGVDSLRGGRDELRKVMKKAKPLDIDVLVDGKSLPGGILSIEIMNIIYTGPGLPLAPSADPSDRMLEVAYVRPADRKAMTAWIKAPQHRRPPVGVRRGREVKIIWRGDPIRVDDDVIDAPDRTATVTVTLERASAKVLVLPPRGIGRLWR